MEEVFTLLSSLAFVYDRLEALEGLKPALRSLSKQEMADGLKNINLTPVIDCLYSDQSSLIQTACDILHLLLSSIEPALVLERWVLLCQIKWGI